MGRAAIWLRTMGASTFDFTGANRQRLERELPDLEVVDCRDEADFLKALEGAEIAVVWRFEQGWFERAPRLRWVVTPAAGRDYFQVSPPRGVRIHYGTFHGKLMGETALAMLLGACRGVIDTALVQHHEPWPRERLAQRMRLLRGSHLVILGFGHIGEWIGRMAKPLGVRLTGVRRQSVSPPLWFEAGDRVLPVDELDGVLPEADHLVLCLPATPETDHLLDSRRLALLPPFAWVYNLGRGNAIDEAALAAALMEHRLAGACLDVYHHEPLPAGSPLRGAPNLLLMPHASALAPEYLDTFLDEFIPWCRAEILGR